MKTSPKNGVPKKMKALKKDIFFVKKGVVELERLVGQQNHLKITVKGKKKGTGKAESEAAKI